MRIAGLYIPPLAIAYAVLDYALSLPEGRRLTGYVRLCQLFWQDWDVPGARLQFTQTQLEDAVDKLKQQKLLTGLDLGYIPGAEEMGSVMQWARPLDQMQEEIWQSMMS